MLSGSIVTAVAVAEADRKSVEAEPARRGLISTPVRDQASAAAADRAAEDFPVAEAEICGRFNRQLVQRSR